MEPACRSPLSHGKSLGLMKDSIHQSLIVSTFNPSRFWYFTSSAIPYTNRIPTFLPYSLSCILLQRSEGLNRMQSTRIRRISTSSLWTTRISTLCCFLSFVNPCCTIFPAISSKHKEEQTPDNLLYIFLQLYQHPLRNSAVGSK